MRYLLPIKQHKSAGFTLIEILIIAPIVVLMIGVFVGLMVSMVGDVLSTRDQSALTYDTQSALDRIEQDTRLSTQFLLTSGTLTAPQGADSNFTGTSAFTNDTSLVFSELATDKNPTDISRGLVYYANQPNPCGTTQRFNRVMLTKVVYFIKSGSLWRRTIVPDFNVSPPVPDTNTTCAAPWQQDSCSPGYSASQCGTNDEEILKNLSSMDVLYYGDPGNTTPIGAANALNASTIGVTLTTSKAVAGRTVSNTSSTRASKLNSIDTTLLPPSAPTVSDTTPTPNSAQFSWTSSATATSYQVAYQINGGTWTTQTLDANTVSFTVSAERNNVISFKVAAFNAAGGSSYATDSVTLPDWTTIPLNGSWVDYGGTMAQHGFTRTKDNVVSLRGLIKNGATTTDFVIGTLPEGYRPTNRLIFVTSTYTTTAGTTNSAEGRVSIFPDGQIVISESNATWFSLNGISFMADNPSQTWVAPTLTNGWTNFGLPQQTLRLTTDADTRVHLQGDVKQGTFTTGTQIAPLAAAYKPPQYMLFPAKSDLATSGFNSFGVDPTTSAIVARGMSSAYLNTNAIYYPTAFAGWTPLTLKNNWLLFNSGFSTAQYAKGSDNLVLLKGVIKSGTIASGTIIATLPAGYRPLQDMVFSVNQNNGIYGRVDILAATGDIVTRFVSNTWTSLDGISFIADQ